MSFCRIKLDYNVTITKNGTDLTLSGIRKGNKYFGTDGFRGEANLTLTSMQAYKVGRFLGWYYSEKKRRAGDNTPARIVIGKDTRRSSYMFEYSLVGGLTASASILPKRRF